MGKDEPGPKNGNQHMVKLGNIKDTMKNGFPRSLDGRLMDAHEVLNSTASASS